ncbi:MAG: nitroreductase [Gammaproteobacteria bacterium]|nr:MAG: nitroreductase [Gammaproteobacteria bacterium]
MNITEVIKNRHSVRSFLDKNVAINDIKKILDCVKHSPSGTNIQPWQIASVTGNSKKNLTDKMQQEFLNGVQPKMDYDYYPSKWVDPFASRRKECGLAMYKTLNIKREDKQKQKDQWAANYRGFDAPVLLFFFLDKSMQTGAFIDIGIIMQSIMLSATEMGLATCPQASLAMYPDVVKRELNFDRKSILVAGIALGYENKKNIINSYRTDREDLKKSTKYFS